MDILVAGLRVSWVIVDLSGFVDCGLDKQVLELRMFLPGNLAGLINNLSEFLSEFVREVAVPCSHVKCENTLH